MRSTFAPRSIVAIALLVGVGSGCTSGTGGCGTMAAIPVGQTPFGVPNNQVIEGGVQARLTAQGLTKFSSVVENLLSSQLMTATSCIIKKNDIYGTYGDSTGGWLTACPDVQTACAQAACNASIIFDSSQRPAPFNIQDNVDKISFSMADGSNPLMTVDVGFDLDVPIKISWELPFDIDNGVCTADLYTAHYRGDATKKNFHVTAPIQLGIDPVTGKLTLTTQAVTVQSLGLQLNASSCGTFGDIISNVVNTILDALDSSIGNFLLNFATAILQPQIDQFVHSLLPNPLGLAGVVNTGAMLAKFDAPKTAGLETYLVPGGYVSAKDKGLTLGVLAGMNSDHDPATRTGAKASEPDPCVPARPVESLGAAPWNLPANASRSDFTLNPADAFAGSPDPVDSMGKVRDLLIGISRTYFDLIGFHLYNSGSLCLHVDGLALPQLNTGTLSVLVPSLSNIALEPKAPLQLILRPQTPVTFTLGAGTTMDPLMHIAIADLRIDMYTWIEERWVRFITIALDLNLGVNLTVTKDANMNPVLQPMLSGLDTQNVTVRVTNTDLLAELPSSLEAVFPSLIGIAAGGLTSAIPNIALPSIPGFSLSDMSVQRVQTSQDDFLGIFATILTPTSPAPLIDWSDPTHPHLAGEVATAASVTQIVVPTADGLRANFDKSVPALAARPTVKLALSAKGALDRPVEFAWKIDGGVWREWTMDAAPVIADDAFLLMGHHQITVRSRVVGDYMTEDMRPVTLDFIIDSIPPELHPHLDDADSSLLDFGGWDLVSDADHLDYAYLDETGKLQPFSKTAALSVAEVGRITNAGQKRLVVSVRNEAGLVTTLPLDVTPFGHGSWGVPQTTTTTGCGCELGGAPTRGTSPVWLALLGLGLLSLRSRARGRLLLRTFRAPTLKSLSRPLIVLGLLGGAGALLIGCGCDKTELQCTVDDDCQKMKCDAGKLPQCQSNMCVCIADITPGNTGRFETMALIGPTAYVAAYNETYGDLMIGSVQPPGRIENWDFVDGVPDEGPSVIGSHVRGGVATPGPDVGQYTAIAATPSGTPVVAYYDVTNGALKFASFGAIRWRSHIVDKGQGLPETMGDSIGTWASISIDSMGRPGIAYSALVYTGTQSGKAEGQLRYAQATTADPQASTDWTITVVDSRPLPVDTTTGTDGGAPVVLLPDSIAIMTAVARNADDTAVIAYYDRERGNLRLAREDGTGAWTTSILDGEATDGTDTGDVGQFPSLLVDLNGIAYLSYVDASHDNLLYVDTKDLLPTVVDDGYRPMDEMTGDGLPSPVYHLVGDSSSIQAAGGYTMIAYQDSTAVELMLATRDMTGKWATQKIAGHDNPFSGAYGFWANARAGGRGAYVSSYAINQQVMPADYFVEVFFVDLGIIN